MKVYVVTSGCYSDYGIDKVFTDRAKAEEFCEWHTSWMGDTPRIEEYETEDELIIDKHYEIRVEYTWCDNGEFEPSFEIAKCSHKYEEYTDYDEEQYRNKHYYNLILKRYVSAQNWDEEFYRNKYKKAAYDLAAIVKMRKTEGFSEKDIQKMLRNGV